MTTKEPSPNGVGDVLMSLDDVSCGRYCRMRREEYSWRDRREDSQDQVSIEYCLDLKPNGAKPLKVILEPWGEEHILQPGSVIKLSFNAPSLTTIPITHENDVVIIEGTEEVVPAGVWLDGQLVG